MSIQVERGHYKFDLSSSSRIAYEILARGLHEALRYCMTCGMEDCALLATTTIYVARMFLLVLTTHSLEI